MEEFLEIAKKSFPPGEKTESLEGLQKEVEILWDKWGIPHIYANSAEDAFFAQGYVHSLHRLWQMELYRRLITGELSEIVGEAALDSDKHYKIIGLHRTAKDCLEKMQSKKDNEILKWLKAYVKGVNTGIERARINPPIEFVALDLKIRDWTIEDSLKIASYIDWGLSNWNYPLEMLRERLIIKLGHEMANKLIPLYSGTMVSNSIGSNAWAISPKKSESGSALMASDPHLAFMNPAIWFLIHINCPDFNSVGTSLVGLPLIVIGHNDKIVWGLTDVMADTVDLFRLEINPENENQYKYNGQWINFDIIKDPIKIQGQSNPLQYEIQISKFGPVIDTFEGDGRIFYKFNLPGKYALRWSSYGPDLEDTIRTFIHINKASNWEEFREALKELTINPQNFIYADVMGNIGHQHGGKIPVRNYGSGCMITPGTDEKYNWKDLSQFEKLLSIYNPESGFVYTANYNEDKAPNGLLLAQDSITPYRQIRIKRLLQSKDKISFQDFKDFQLDLYTEEAAEYLPIMLRILKSNESSKNHSEIIKLLEDWDYQLKRTSIAGAIYKIWFLEIQKAILIPLIGEELLNPFLGTRPFNLERLFKLYDNKPKELEASLLKALQSTIDFLTKRISPDINRWHWGNLHKLTLVHPFSLANEDAKALNIGPFKFGGDGNTLASAYCDNLDTFDVLVGPSIRHIHDLSDWNKSIWSLPGGQSGLPFHKHYSDLIKLYVKGKYIPMLFSRDTITENLEGTYKLTPK